MARLTRPSSRARLRTSVVGLAVAALAVPGLGAQAHPSDPHPAAVSASVDSTHHLSPLVDPAAGVYVVTLASPDLARDASVVVRADQHMQQEKILTAVGRPRVLYRYTTALNGFAARLSTEQVRELRRRHDVVSVERDTTARLDTTGARDVDAAARAARTPASRAVSRDAGSGVVVGLLDSGLWPENPAFDGADASPAMLARQFPRFSGTCQPGEGWSTTMCTTKIVGARWFAGGFLAANPSGVATGDYLSARDWTGHGSLSASVTAGNPGITMTVDGRNLGPTDGVAPGAGIAAYKVCWASPDPRLDGCRTSDVVRAIDQADRDGVDVLSYPASGPVWQGRSAVVDALRGAATDGVSVVTSAGNTGPHQGTVHADGPWTTTVAASGGQRFPGTVRLGDGTTVTGAMLSNRHVGPTRLVDASTAAATGVTGARAALCAPGSLDASAVRGAVVLCRRGDIARVEKSAAVAQAGGVGMVLANTDASEIDSDRHAVPTVHITERAAHQVYAYLRSTPRPQVTLVSDAADLTAHGEVPRFSSRGPTLDGRVLKPDLASPGLNVAGAAAPPTAQGRLWTVGTGTSVSTAFVAGASAVLREVHPRWTPAMVRSALMTSAERARTRDVFATGSGDLAARRALDPGLVLTADPRTWARHAAGDIDDVNQPSISLPDLMGRTTVVRRFTNVSDHTETYVPRLRGLPGVDVLTRPGSFRLAPGESARVRVVVEATRGANYSGWASGYLTWDGSRGHTVQMPMAVRPVLAELPEEASTDGSSLRIRARAGVTGALRVTTVPAVAAQLHQATVAPGASTTATYTVPAGTPAARFTTSTTSGVELDSYVYRGGQLVAASVDRPTATVTLRDPQPGTYRIVTRLGPTARPELLTTAGWVLSPHPTPGSRPLRLTQRRWTVNGGAPFVVTGAVARSDARRSTPYLGAVLLPEANQLTLVTAP